MLLMGGWVRLVRGAEIRCNYCLVAGFFEAPGAKLCMPCLPPSTVLPDVTLVFCAIVGLTEMKVGIGCVNAGSKKKQSHQCIPASHVQICQPFTSAKMSMKNGKTAHCLQAQQCL